ncbi:Copine family protein [Acanthocheilonema viteae]
MKRGFRYLFNQEKLNNKNGNDDVGVEQKRGFFQKFFHPTSSRSLGGGEGTSAEPERRPLLHDDDEYAVIDRQQDEFVISINKEKREMSAPLSPKSVTFEDELLSTATERRGQSVAPPPTFLTRTTTPTQQAFINFDYDVSQILGINHERDVQSPSRSTLSDREYFSPVRSSRDASLALDEATNDLLRLSSQPPSVWYSSSSRPLHADRIPKSASTTSMNKIIRTKDGELVKLSNAFTWETDRLSDLGPSDASTYVDKEGRRHQTVTIYSNEKRQGPPIVRTTVEGKLRMEKVVGANLISVKYCTCSAWTICDTTTHYKVRTTLGNRTLIMEESMDGENRDRDFKMSLYEDGQLKTKDVADFQIPSNVDKAKYLSLLSQRLLHDMEILNQQEEPKTTRVEVEVIENVTKILKTYIVGERNDLLQDHLVDQTVSAVDKSTYDQELLTSSYDFTEKEYMDVSEKEAITIQPSADIKFLFEGHHYEDHSEIRSHQRTGSEATTTSESAPSSCIYINVECILKRMEDRSLNEVNVAVPNVFSAVLSLIRERILPQLPNIVSYGMEQHGKQYSGETTIKRLHRFESTESFDEVQKAVVHTRKEQPSFLFEKPQIIEPVKIPVLNITELDLRRMADTSAILANFAIPRTDQSQLDIERRYEFREAQGGSYGIQQKGQHFEGEMILKKKRRLFLESESISEEDICGPTYLNLTKQEARGEFEVAIIISNDHRSSPKHFQESEPTEVINLIAQISTNGKKEEILATLATKISCKEVFSGQEMNIVTSNAIITIDKLASTVMMSCDNVRHASRFSDGHVLKTKAATEETAIVMLSMGHVSKYSNQLTIEFIVKDVSRQKASLYSRASLENERASNVSLNRGSKMLAASIRLFERMKQNEQMTITEFGDEREQVVILLQRAGIMCGQVQREWPEAVTGRSRTTCTTINTTTTKTFNIFEALTDTFMTTADFPSTDLTTNTTIKHFHLSNFKTILPTHSMAQKIFPLIEVATVSLNLSVNYTQPIPENFDEIRVKIARLCNIDEIKQQINEKEASLQMFVKTMKDGDDNSGQVGEIFDTFRRARDTCTNEVSIMMEPQWSDNDLRDETKVLSSLHTTFECIQSGTELSFSCDSHYIHEKSTKQSTVNVENTKESPKTSNILGMDETKTDDANDICEVFPQSKHQTKKERIVPIEQISTISSSNMNSNEDWFSDAQKQWITAIYDNSRSSRVNSFRPFDAVDSYRTTDHLFRSMEHVNDNCRMENLNYLESASHNLSERQESMSLCNNIYEACLTLNPVDNTREQQLEYGQKSKRMHLQEFLYDAQQKEQQQLYTFPRVKQKELKGKLYNTASETRVAMLHAGFDLDTTLLATPEIETQSTFVRDRSVTTSEYFSDERSWTATTESYYKQRNIHMEQISKSAADLYESSLEENSGAFDEISHISDATYNHMKQSEIANPEKINMEMIHSFTTSLESSALKEFLALTEGESSTVSETCRYDVTIEKSKQHEASSVVFSAGYHDFIQPKKIADEALIAKKEETDSEIDELKKKYHDSMSVWGTNVKHIQDEIPPLSLEHQNEIFQQTTSSTTETMEITEHMILGPVQNKNIAIVDTGTGTIETHKQEVRHNISEVDYHQAIPQALSTSPKTIAKVLVSEQEISQTGAITFSKVTQPIKQAWSETAPISRDLITTLQMSTMESEKTDDRLNFKEMNNRFNAVAHFPPKFTRKLISKPIVVTEKAVSVTQDEIGAVTKTPRTKIVQEQEELVKEFEQVRQHTVTQFEIIEGQMTTTNTFRDSEFLEEMKHLKGETQVLSKVQQENRDVRELTEGFTEQTHKKRQLMIAEELVKPELSEQVNMQEIEEDLSIYQQTSTKWKFVKCAKTESEGQFYQIERRGVNAEVHGVIKESLNLQIATNLTASTLNVSRLELEIKKASAITDAAIESNQITIATDTTEAELIQNTDLRYTSDQVANIDRTLEVTNIVGKEVILGVPEFEAKTRNFTELCKSEEKIEHAVTVANAIEYNEEATNSSDVFQRITVQGTVEQCTKIITDEVEPQIDVDAQSASNESVTEDIVLEVSIGYKEEALVSGLNEVLRRASAEKVIPLTQIHAEKLAITAITEQNIEFSRMIEKMESFDTIGAKRSLKEVATDKKQLMITSKSQEHSLLKKSSDEECSNTIPDIEIIRTQAYVVGYGTAQIVTTGSFARLEHKEVAEKAETQIVSSVKLESYFNTQLVASESSSLEIQLECNRNTQLDVACNIAQKSVAKFMMNLKAAREEVDGLVSTFKTQAEHTSSVACVLSDKICETISSRIYEFGSEHQQYMAHWDMVQNALSAETYVAVAEFGDITCTVDAVKHEDVEIIKPIEQPELSELTDKTISLKLHASEIGKWKIVQRSAEAVFQRSNEQAAREATINISIGYVEDQNGIFQEYGSISTEIAAHFARVLIRKTENEAKISSSVSRHWKECLDLEACRECIANLEQLLVKDEPSEIVKCIWREVNHEKAVVGFIASSEIYETCVVMFDKQSQCQSLKTVLKDRNQEWIISEQYVVQSEIAKLIDTTWTIIVNDFDSAINICESNREQVTLNTSASQELQLESKHVLCMKPPHENASIHFRTITAVSGDERHFKIESKMKESILTRSQEELFAESVQKEILRAENLTESITEISEAQLDAGILLMRRSAKKTTEAASHVVSVVLTLSEHLKTRHAEKTSKDASVEFSIPASNLEVEDNICQSAINRGIVSLETKCAKAVALQETIELTKSREVLDGTESILKKAHTDTVFERLKETNFEGFEILSQWTTVDRDLEAEVKLLHTRNIVSKFSTLATSEEETSIGETWIAAECNTETCTVRNVITSECCQRSFQIEFDEVRIWLENFEKEGSSEMFLCGKNHDTLYVSVHESILEKLSAVISLYRVSNVLSKQIANEYIWREQQFLATLPLYISCEDIEADYTTVDVCLEREVAQKYFETVQISSNQMEMEIFVCEETGDEKLHMAVKLQGKRLAPLGVEVIWPEARKEDGIIVDMEEYREDQVILYEQLTSGEVRFAEFNMTVIISEDYEPQMLITNTTKEEIVNGYEEFRIVPQEKTINYVMIIGNKGECLSIWLQETKQNFVTVGFQYSEQAEEHEMEGNFAEKRFGGNYQLVTKSAQAEDRNASVAMLRQTENETITEVLKENIRSFSSMEVLASTSKIIVIDINWEKTPQTALALTQRPCSRKAEPIRSRFLEIGETTHTVYAQFRIKEVSWKTPVIWKVPNYGGHLTLNTESAEETISDREIEYHKYETSETAVKTLKQVVTMIAPVLSAQHVTEVTKEIRTDLVRPSPIDQVYLLFKQANRGVNIGANLIETTDIKQSSYLQLAREIASVKLEKIIKEARFGGKLNLTTGASEEYELNVIRELTNGAIRIAHCSQLIVSKNWSRGTSCEVIAAKSESANVHINLRNSESTDDASRTMCQKPLIRNTLTIQESEIVVLTINLNYIKQRAKEISEKTIWLARNSEPCILTTSAATDEQKLVQWILEKRRDTFLSASRRIIIKNVVKILPLETIQPEFVEIAVCSNLQRTIEMLKVCKTLIASNRGYDVYWKLHETCEENECLNYQFKQENAVEQVEAILRQPCYGGRSIMNTSATKECMTDVTLRLESKLPTQAEIYFSIDISNKNIPVVFSAKSTVLVESNEVITLKRKHEAKEVEIIRKIANMDTAQIVTAQMSLEAESVIIKYQHKDEHMEIQKTIFIAFYGGHQKLETFAANKIITDIYEEIISKHLMFAEACLHQVVANVARPCNLSTQSSKLEESNQEYHLQKKQISENEVTLMLLAANYEFSKFSTIESSSEIETITTHWQRDGTYEEVRLCICDKRFGGNLLLSTHFAQESSIIFTAALTASRSSLEKIIFTIVTARHSAEQPILATSSTTEMYAELSCHLNRPSTGQQSTVTIHAANQIKGINVQLTESTIISETTNIQYQRPNIVVGTFSEVFPEARFGGSLILNTFAAKETSISIQSLQSFQGAKQLEVQIVFVDKNRTSEMCHMLAIKEQTLTANLQLQKPSDLSNVEIVKRASRRADNRSFTFIESKEINQFNNFLWKNPAETNAEQITILKEIRYGGRLELSTGYATEQAVTITDTLKQTSAELSSTVLRKTANQGESVNISCSASQANYISINLELQSKKLAQLEVSTSRKAANHEVPQKLITNESSELVLTTNVTIQKSLDYESAQTVWKAKKQGGIIEIQCNASKESYAELYICLESKLLQKKHVGAMLIIHEVHFGENVAMNLMAAEEIIFNFEISFEKQDVESKQSYTVKAINVALPEILNTTESLESVIEIEKVEVWKRLSEMHAEFALKLARQCLPVSLQTDSAEETFIRHESEMCVDVQRTTGAIEIEKSATIMEREALTCTEAVNVTLRYKAVDEEQEEKVEKRVSFAAEVTEKTMSMDMNVTVEQRETPHIVKKPMKKEQYDRKPTLRQNEAPNFIPVRRNSLLLAMELGDAHNIPHYKTLEDVIKGIKKAGLEYSNLIFGIDYTQSNKYQGERTFDGRNLHDLSSDEMNPYQQVIEIVGKTLSSFDADGVIPTYGFGDEESSDHGIFNLNDRNDINAECNGFEEVLRIYTDITPSIRMSGPTNFVPLIEQAVSIVREKHSYHILVIVADGQVTNEKINQKAIAAASRYPLSIIMVGVGDGPWNMMTRFDETLPKRMFDNFHFVDFHKVMFNAPNQEASFALNALMEIPDQYKAIKELGLLKHSRRG